MDNQTIAQLVATEARRNQIYSQQLMRALQANNQQMLLELIKKVVGTAVVWVTTELLNALKRHFFGG